MKFDRCEINKNGILKYISIFEISKIHIYKIYFYYKQVHRYNKSIAKNSHSVHSKIFV